MRRIAILDTGVGASEDDFVKLHVKKSFDFTTPKFSESNIGLDDNGHGTTCAKIILKNAAKSEIYSLKVLDKNRSLYCELLVVQFSTVLIIKKWCIFKLAQTGNGYCRCISYLWV